MSNETENDRLAASADNDGDETVAKLLNLAGPRDEISPDIERRVHETVQRDWQRATNRRNTLRWAVPATIAAALVLAMTVSLRTPDRQYQPVGVIAQVLGTPSGDASFAIGSPVYAGDRLETGYGRGMTVTLFDDVSLRIAANTALRFDAADEVSLLGGELYVDTGERIYRDRHLTINTPKGKATDIGTQFLVEYGNERLRVAVREGRVDVINDRASFTASAGEQLTLQTGDDVVVDQVSPYDESWEWAIALAPAFEIDNHSLLDFLKWASRETGKSLNFASDELRMAAMKTELFGSISDFTPAQAIDAVLATTRFKYQVDDTSITIVE